MISKRSIAAAAAAVALSFSAGVPLASAASRTVLDLQLNGAYGSRTAVDSSGLRHNGAIGSHVRMNGQYAHFDWHPESGSYGSAHLITVPDASDSSLDPGSGNFSVVIRYRTTDSDANLIQKGQATTPGGMVKLEQPNGIMTCIFQTPQGTAVARSAKRLNDGVWHTVRCDRTSTTLTMYVDNVVTARTSQFTGTLNNTKPWAIGGKAECNGVQVDCDYFYGDIDYVKMTKG